MNKWIGFLFTLIYIVLAGFMALIMSVHGPELIGYFAAAYLLIAVAALWWIYYFVERRQLRRSRLIFSLSGSGLGLLLAGTLFASWSPLVVLDVYRSEKRAANTQVFDMRDELLLSQNGNPI